MQKKIILVTLVALLLPVAALALDTPPSGGLTLDALINDVKIAIWTIFGLIAVVAFITAGILFLTAGGAPEKVQAARSAFIWGVAGVIVAVIAWSIVSLISGLLI